MVSGDVHEHGDDVEAHRAHRGTGARGPEQDGEEVGYQVDARAREERDARRVALERDTEEGADDLERQLGVRCERAADDRRLGGVEDAATRDGRGDGLRDAERESEAQAL
ncbi:MAG: hypothetical protein EBZ77_17690, partial [Chitinophagia bacterium]|nr:hypothetical protein [Chitinophagia bacterium]